MNPVRLQALAYGFMHMLANAQTAGTHPTETCSGQSHAGRSRGRSCAELLFLASSHCGAECRSRRNGAEGVRLLFLCGS